MPLTLRRSMLFTPGDRPDRIAKALEAAEADVLVMDWEDAVAPGSKDAARAATANAYATLPSSRTSRVIRVNPRGSPWHETDVSAAVALGPDAILLPKVEAAEDVVAVAKRIEDLEGEHGVDHGRVSLLLLVESGRGVLNAHASATASPRVAGLVFGADDYQVDVGGRRRRDNMDVLHARSHVAMAAAAAGLVAVDQVFTDIDDKAELWNEASFARDLGYRGKIVIHPKQVPVVNEVFSPSPERIAWAREIVEAAERAQRDGRGAFSLHGRMVDRPIVMQARRVMEDAREAGLL